MLGVDQSAGIHSIAINNSKTLLAAGSGLASDIIKVYKLPTFEPIAVLKGHLDMVFSLHWIQDTILVSGSRDKSLKLWKVPECQKFSSDSNLDLHLHDNLPQLPCYASKVEHSDKVRDLGLDKITSQLYSLSADGLVKIWDCKKSFGGQIVSVPLIYSNEAVCLGIDPVHHLVSVGSQSHISLIDPREGAVVHTFESADKGWGVRSLNITNSLITAGGGRGRISFYDLRKMNYISWDSNICANNNKPQTNESQSMGNTGAKRWLEPSEGWLSQESIYLNHFQLAEIKKKAIYTLAYDANGTRLFTAGGPLQLNIKGSHAGIWY